MFSDHFLLAFEDWPAEGQISCNFCFKNTIKIDVVV